MEERSGSRAVRRALAGSVAAVLSLGPAALGAQLAEPADELADLTGPELYEAACANCHASDGTGASPEKVAFAEPLPDFTDCSFASREPDADWVAVAHQGGPVRGFSPMMPAFGAVLTVDQLQRVMEHVRTLCGDDDWPRGELNFPRPFLTEKAYPEDEAVLASAVDLEGSGSVMNELVYEKRFGARNQWEVVVPFGFVERGGEVPDPGDWVGGLGDIVLGVKRDVLHSFERGSILSVAAEVKLPTGDDSEGFGTGTTVFESFVSYGQALPSDGFLQLQGVYELPADRDLAEEEAVWRGALGRTFTEGPWGRAWTPMVEIQGARELEEGAGTSWDLVPQLQVTLNTRQHVMLNAGVLLPLTEGDVRSSQLWLYLLWDWFDGGFLEGW